MRCQGDAEDAEDAEDASSFTRHPKILTAPVMWIPVSPLVRIDRHVPLPMRWKSTTPHNRIGSNDYYCESYHSELLALSKTIPKSSNPSNSIALGMAARFELFGSIGQGCHLRVEALLSDLGR